ncbi:hypothetical protein PR048_004184 [Dryococelus australis]|uniref:Uncharacterized protein n=1 Tax=Dryococelus australis TaxID=614101 RepID=A0ABQ9I4R9_9NEOP|nr:hypothetical protein PR048_004184 [Dryococelus australis]
MEHDVVVEGFKNRESMGSLQFKYVIGNGDSSVYSSHVQNVSYGHSIHKVISYRVPHSKSSTTHYKYCTTLNSAEFYVSLLAKCNAGKSINLMQQGSFKRRCYVAGLQYSRGHSWELSPLKTLTGRSLGRTHAILIKRKMQHHEAVKRRRLDYPSNKQTKRHEVLAPPVQHYGPNVLELVTSQLPT